MGLFTDVSSKDTVSPVATTSGDAANEATGGSTGWTTVITMPLRLVPASLVARSVTRYRPGSVHDFSTVEAFEPVVSPKSQISLVGSLSERSVKLTI